MVKWNAIIILVFNNKLHKNIRLIQDCALYANNIKKLKHTLGQKKRDCLIFAKQEQYLLPLNKIF